MVEYIKPHNRLPDPTTRLVVDFYSPKQHNNDITKIDNKKED